MQMDDEAECVVAVPRQTVHINQCEIDFVEAAESHIKWRNRLKNHIDGVTTEEWSPSVASMEDCCGLGRWLRGAGRMKFGHFSSFRRLEVEHAEFHGFAGMILAKVQEGERGAAEELLKNEFSQATRRTLIAINEVNEVMQQAVAA